MDITTLKTTAGLMLTLRMPARQQVLPVIVLCHGFCGIRDILLPAYAEAFTRAGYCTITFDYHGFGDSEGERGRLIPREQIDDILSVIRWVREQPSLNKERIALWGTALGGCHIFGAAARDGNIKCLVSQLAFADGEAVLTGHMDEAEKKAFILTLDKMAEKRKNTGKKRMVNITRVLNNEESKRFFDATRVLYPKMDIKIPFLTVRETLKYKPALDAAKVVCPTLVVIAEKDTVNPPSQGLALFNAVGASEKSLYKQKEASHYDMYTGIFFKKTVLLQTEWFNKHL